MTKSVGLELERRDLRLALSAIEDPELAEATLDVFIEVAGLVASGKVDLVVLAARRLTCVYQALLGRGLPIIPCEVISDRVLDLGEGVDYRGRKAVIVDDCVILGRTLSDLVLRVRNMTGRAVVRSIVICADRQQSDEALLTRLKVDVKCWKSTHQTQQYSLNLARVLYQNGVPYFSDFPVTQPLEINARTYASMLQLEDWVPVETTPALLRGPGQECFSLIPRPKVDGIIRGLIGDDLSGLVVSFKVRMFFSFDSMVGEMVLVPLALLRPMPVSEVDLHLNAISDQIHVHSETSSGWPGWGVEAKYRLLQMFVSVVVLKQLWTDAVAESSDLGELAVGLFDLDAVALHFGGSAAAEFKLALQVMLVHEIQGAKASARRDQDHASAPSRVELDEGFQVALNIARSYLAENESPALPHSDGVLRIGETFVRPLAGVFGYVGGLESVRRRAIRRSGSSAAEANEVAMRWLNEGVSLQTLSSAVNGSDSAVLTTVALDVCNDLGIAVPMTYTEENDWVGRRYRIGENVFLAFDIVLGTKRAREGWPSDPRRWFVPYFRSLISRADETLYGGPPIDGEAGGELLSLLRRQAESVATHRKR